MGGIGMDIRLRAWDKTNEKMVYQSPVSSCPETITWEGIVYRNGYVQNYVMMFCTFLRDKNGREIWEGDILEYNGDKCPHCEKLIYNDHHLYEIVWRADELQFACENDENYMMYTVWNTEMRVVGNENGMRIILGDKVRCKVHGTKFTVTLIEHYCNPTLYYGGKPGNYSACSGLAHVIPDIHTKVYGVPRKYLEVIAHTPVNLSKWSLK
jgi:hypothetical protein